MAVFAQPQQGKVKQRHAGFQRAGAILLAQGLVIAVGGALGRAVGWNAQELARPDEAARQQTLAYHAVIGVLILRRHKAFVAEKQFGAIPVDVLGRQKLIGGARGRAARQHQAEGIAGDAQLTSDDLGGAGRQCGAVLHNFQRAGDTTHLPPRMRIARQERPSLAKRSLAAMGPSLPAA